MITNVTSKRLLNSKTLYVIVLFEGWWSWTREAVGDQDGTSFVGDFHGIAVRGAVDNVALDPDVGALIVVVHPTRKSFPETTDPAVVHDFEIPA